MSQKSPGRHEPPNAPEIRHMVDEILALSREILNQSTNPRIPHLSQLILKRGELMNELNSADMGSLPDPLRGQCLEKLEACRRMDETISHNLVAVKTGMEEHLKGCREAHTLLAKYRVGSGESGTIRSEEA